ncbi:MAG: hypothetical protein ACREO1_03550 [Arenimonas sp.]
MKKQETQLSSLPKNKKAKKAYASPSLKQYGAIHLMTQGSGAVNGDGGMGMMV